MNNYTFGYNHNSLAYNPQFSQSEGNNVLQNNQMLNSTPCDIVEISKKNGKKKSTFEKVLTGLAWVGTISLGLFGIYKFVEYKNPGFFKKNFSGLKEDKFVEEKSSKERSFWQTFNTKFGSCKVDDPGKNKNDELKYVENAFKNNEISDKEKSKFEEKINMRFQIRTFNLKYNTEIPLTPYGGVEKIVEAAKTLQNQDAKNEFNAILDYKIKKLEEKLALLEQRKSLNNYDLEVCIKANRTNDLIESLKEIKSDKDKKECFKVTYNKQYIKDQIISKDAYQTELENEFGETYQINLSEDTFRYMFSENEMMRQNIADCYLVGTMNAIINNPQRRCEFYQMFSEDEKSIIFTFKDGFKVKFLKDNEGKPKLLSNNYSTLSGDIGYQMFEEAYALHRLYERAKNGYKKVEKNEKTEKTATAIKEYAQKDNKSEDEFEKIIVQSKDYIDADDKLYTSILEGGTIHEVANSLFNTESLSYVLKGFHNSDTSSTTESNNDDVVSQRLTEMMKKGKSIVVGRDEFNVNGNEEKYNYHGIDIHNSHFSVVRYYNSKTKEVHIFESNEPDKVLILPLSIFNQQYSLLYGF